jgi:uncharacterized protein (DUF1330 family)
MIRRREPVKTVRPTRESLSRLSALPKETPIVMVNLLKFRQKSLYPQGSSFDDCTGRQAYKRYMDIAVEKLSEVGAKPLWMSKALVGVIAPAEEQWDQVLLVKYPSVDAFLTMIGMPDYLAATVHREAALEDSRLIATIEILSEI